MVARLKRKLETAGDAVLLNAIRPEGYRLTIR